MTEPAWAALVPELTVADLTVSRKFYVETLGFVPRYARAGFVYLDRGAAQLMLEQGPSDWQTAPLEPPLGRGINLQIEVDAVDALHAQLVAAGHPIFRSLTDSWYQAGDIEHGQREFLVQDLDGYLLRFVQPIGDRSAN